MACAAWSTGCEIARGRQGQVQNVVAVAILHGVKGCDRAVRAPGDHNADFLREIDKAFQHQRLRGQSLPGRVEVVGRAERGLTLAVVPEAGGLQDRRQAEALDRRLQFHPGRNRRPWGGRDAGGVEKGLFIDPVLADPQHRGCRTDRAEGGEKIQSLGADILEFEADHVHRGGECPQRHRVAVVADGDGMGHLCRGAIGFPREDMAAIPQTSGRQRGHPAKLPAADQPYGRIGRQREARHDGSAGA